MSPSTDPQREPPADLPRTVIQPPGEATPAPSLPDDITRTYGGDRPADAGPAPRRVGKYEVIRALGDGGQATAYLAFDPDLRRQVVLKLYHAARTPAEQDMVLKEGQALARVRSPYVAHCYSAERHDGVPYLVMEYIAGRSLAEAQRTRPLDLDRSLEVVGQLAEGLAAVHGCGLLHRDIKPSNVILGDDGLPRLVDFGLAEPLASAALARVSGTIPYMAPEQARGERDRIDARTDLFALGAVLYELLTGTPPYQGKTRQELLDAARAGVIVPPRERDPKVPAAVNDVCRRCLAREPADRFGSAGELAEAVRRCRRRRGWRGLDLSFRLGRYKFQLAVGATVALLLLVLTPLAFRRDGRPGQPQQQVALKPDRPEPRDDVPVVRQQVQPPPEPPAARAAPEAAPAPPAPLAPRGHGKEAGPRPLMMFEKSKPPARHPVNGRLLREDFAFQVRPAHGTLAADGKLLLKPGEPLALTLEVPQRAYVGVWFARADGSFLQLLPSEREPDGWVSPGRPRTVPPPAETVTAGARGDRPEYVEVRAALRRWEAPEPARRPLPPDPLRLYATPEDEKAIRDFLLGPWHPDAPAAEVVIPVQVRP